jgi:hypothetical protein
LDRDAPSAIVRRLVAWRHRTPRSRGMTFDIMTQTGGIG